MADEMTQEIAVREPMQIAQVAQLMSIADVQQTAKAIVTSKMIAGVENESQAIVKILAGQELGLGPIASVNGLYVLNGRVGMMASVAGALLQKGGYHWTSTWDDTDNPTACEVTFYGPTLPATGWTNRFTVADAIRAKLIKTDGAHQKYPKDMLFNRAFMGGARKVAPSCLLNMGYEYDELREATVPPHLSGVPTNTPPVSATPKPAAAPAAIANIPVVNVDSIDCPLHPGTEARLNKWGSAYSHPTAGKNDAGKTIWCNTKVADIKKPSVAEPTITSVEVEQESPVAALEAPNIGDWSKATQADYFKVLDKAILDKGLPAADVKAIMFDQFGYTKRTEITIAKRNDVLKAILE
jgi:hypothetical protein